MSTRPLPSPPPPPSPFPPSIPCLPHLIAHHGEGPVLILGQASGRVYRDALADAVRREPLEPGAAVVRVLPGEPALDHGHAVLREGARLVGADVGRVPHGFTCLLCIPRAPPSRTRHCVALNV